VKQLLGLLTGLLLIFVVVGSVSALSYYEEFTDNEWLNRNNTSATWTFDLDNDTLYAGWFGVPYGSRDINAEDTINSAYFSMRFYDDSDKKKEEFGSLIVDGSTWYSDVEVDGGDMIFAANVTGSLVDHILTVVVKRNSGDFGVDFASLFGDFTDNPVPQPQIPVPEPATMILFGLGLLGLAGVSRKKLGK